MWEGLRDICQREKSNLHRICTIVSKQKLKESSLTATIRVFIVRYFREASTEEGHSKAGHGSGLTLGFNVNGGLQSTQQLAVALTKTSFC